MKFLLHAGYMAVFVVGTTLIAAALVARHVVTTDLIADWTVGFVVILIGALIAARSRRILARIAILTVSAWVAWTIVLSIMPFRDIPSISINVIFDNILERQAAILLGAVWGLVLASFAEGVRNYAGFGPDKP